MNSKTQTTQFLHAAIANVEDTLDVARRRLNHHLGLDKPRQIVAYNSYANQQTAWITGRVLANRPSGGPLDDDTWWDNIKSTYERWESDEVPNVPVTLKLGQQTFDCVTDEEGYYQMEIPIPSSFTSQSLWTSVGATISDENIDISAYHQLQIPSDRAELGIISDLDDTVIHTGITDILLAAKLTFLYNAKTRKPLNGVAALYRELQNGNSSHPVNPIYYISSSAWNLYDLLRDFLELNDIPPGPLLLRDLGIDDKKLIKESGHGHKLENAKKVMDAYPHLPFILIGDSGQQDPYLYVEAAKQYGDRIKGIYIRDVDPGSDSLRDKGVDEKINKANELGIPMLRVSDSVTIAKHLVELGFMSSDVISVVEKETNRDQHRESMLQEMNVRK